MSRKRLRSLVITVLLLLTLTATLNLIINPTGYYGDKQFGIYLWNDRMAKLEHVTKMTSKPQAFILGSSNSLSMPVSAVKEWTGYETFNFGLFHATAEDFYCTGRALYEVAGCNPRLVIICLDDWSLADTEPQNDELFTGAEGRLCYTPELAQFLPDFSRSKLLWGRFCYSISFEQTKLSWLSSYEKVMKGDFTYQNNDLGAFSEDINGERTTFLSHTYPEEDLMKLIPEGKYNTEAALRDLHQSYLKLPGHPLGLISEWHSDFDKFSQRRIDLLEKLVQYLDSKNCKVIISIMPQHPYFLDLLKKRIDYEKRMAELYTLLLRCQEKYSRLILVQDNHTIDKFNGQRKEFFDALHVTPANSRLIIESFKKQVPHDAFQ